jgi:hypothetical protein
VSSRFRLLLWLLVFIGSVVAWWCQSSSWTALTRTPPWPRCPCRWRLRSRHPSSTTARCRSIRRAATSTGGAGRTARRAHRALYQHLVAPADAGPDHAQHRRRAGLRRRVPHAACPDEVGEVAGVVATVRQAHRLLPGSGHGRRLGWRHQVTLGCTGHCRRRPEPASARGQGRRRPGAAPCRG